MSLAGVAATRGSTVSVYRPVFGRNADGSPKVTSWTVVTTGLKLVLEAIGDELAQKLYGAADVVRERALVSGAPDIKPGDGIVVTAGRLVGTAFRVADVSAQDVGRLRPKHLEVALVKTTETIP